MDESKADAALSKWLDVVDRLRSTVPEHMVDSVVAAADTLEPAWFAVCKVFGDKAQPEHALQLLSLILEERRFRASIEQAETD